MEFENHKQILSLNEGVKNSGVRGDGKCALWSILIGLSLLNRQEDIKNYPFFETKPIIKSIEDVFFIIKFIGQKLLELMDYNTKLFSYDEYHVFSRLELEYMMLDFNQNINDITILNGRCHFQILALIFGIEIKILYEDNNQITKIGNPQNDTIRISTNGAHYNVYNNLVYTNSLKHFINRYWWNLQWFSLYPNKKIVPICG